MEVSITPSAEKFIRRMIRFNGGRAESGLRLLVSAGGCSGLSASFSVEAHPPAGDAIIERDDGLRVFLPAESRLLLEGATIDFVDSPLSSGFVFHNAATACGCSSNSDKPATPPGVGTIDVSTIARRH